MRECNCFLFKSKYIKNIKLFKTHAFHQVFTDISSMYFSRVPAWPWNKDIKMLQTFVADQIPTEASSWKDLQM